jgi:hypothetical protein
MKNLFILLACLPFVVLGQQKTNKVSPYTIDLIFSSDSHYGPVGLDGGPGIYQVSAYRVGFNILSDFEEHANWSFRSGLRYAVYNQRLESNLALVDPLRGGIVTSFEKITYCELPLFLRYTMGKNRLKFYGEIGGGLDFLPSVSRNKFQPFWGLSVGLEYHFNPRIGIFTQPIFRKSTQNNRVYFISTGFEMGIKFGLNEK